MNFATATPDELAAAGYTLVVKRSQRTRKHKSVFGVRPTINKGQISRAHKLTNATDSVNGGLIRWVKDCYKRVLVAYFVLL